MKRIHPDQIQVKGFRGKIMYTSIQEALENKRNMSPSPKELSNDFLMNEPFRPVKLKNDDVINQTFHAN